MIWIASLFKSTATKGDETDPGVPSVGIFTLFEDPEVSLEYVSTRLGNDRLLFMFPLLSWSMSRFFISSDWI